MAAFSRKHYQIIAAAIAAQRSSDRSLETDMVLDNLAGDLATSFSADNPRFDRARFYNAAGVVGSAFFGVPVMGVS